MAESGGLENRCTRKGTVGSNPTLSAISYQSNQEPIHAGQNRQCLLIGIRSVTRSRETLTLPCPAW